MPRIRPAIPSESSPSPFPPSDLSGGFKAKSLSQKQIEQSGKGRLEDMLRKALSRVRVRWLSSASGADTIFEDGALRVSKVEGKGERERGSTCCGCLPH